MCAKSRKEWIVVNQSGTDGPPLMLNFSDIRKVGLVMRAADNNLRQKMILLIERNNIMTVTDIYIKLHLPQAIASHHLGILRRAGILTTERQGRFIFYMLDLPYLRSLVENIDQIMRL